MGDWPQGWTRGGASDASRERPARGSLPPELDPRGPRAGRGPDEDRWRAGAPPSAPPVYVPRGSTGGRPRRRRLRPGRILPALVLVVALFYAGLAVWALSRLNRVDALSDRPGTAGTTWLLVGSDSREGLTRDQQNELTTGRTEGRRTDTIILLHAPGGGGEPTLVSLPRDSYVEIPGHGANKLNAAYAFGGPDLLVETAEQVTGLTVDHYVEVGFGGIVSVVDAVGGVELCIDQPIRDERSGLDVDAGCQNLDGGTSLSYVRARYFDPTADLGRIRRQQQFLGALVSEVFSPAVLLNPVRQARLVGAGTGALVVDESTGPVDLALLGWTFRRVTGGDGSITTVPVADPDYRVDGAGSTVLWDEQAAAQLFDDLAAGRTIVTPQ